MAMKSSAASTSPCLRRRCICDARDQQAGRAGSAATSRPRSVLLCAFASERISGMQANLLLIYGGLMMTWGELQSADADSAARVVSQLQAVFWFRRSIHASVRMMQECSDAAPVANSGGGCRPRRLPRISSRVRGGSLGGLQQVLDVRDSGGGVGGGGARGRGGGALHDVPHVDVPKLARELLQELLREGGRNGGALRSARRGTQRV